MVVMMGVVVVVMMVVCDVISNMSSIVVFMAKTVKEFGMKNASSLVLIGLKPEKTCKTLQ